MAPAATKDICTCFRCHTNIGGGVAWIAVTMHPNTVQIPQPVHFGCMKEDDRMINKMETSGTPQTLILRYTQVVEHHEIIHTTQGVGRAISEALRRAIDSTGLEFQTGVDLSSITIELKD